MELSIIIVSYNTKKLLKQTIESIPSKSDWEIICIDNASTDDSVEMIKKEFPRVKVIKNSNNRGFSKANNQGIKKSRGEYILLLNSDTKVKANALENMHKFLKDNPKVGIASCQLLNLDGSIQSQGGYLPSLSNIAFWMLFIDDIPLLRKFLHPYQLRDKKAFTKERQIGWVSAAAMMIKRNVFEKIGFLDESIFMYGEDVEFCLRVNKAGLQVAITPKASIIHFGQQSSGGAASASWLGEYKGIKYIFKKHKPSWEYPIVRLLLKVGALLRMFVFGILQGRKDTYEAYKKAFKLA